MELSESLINNSAAEICCQLSSFSVFSVGNPVDVGTMVLENLNKVGYNLFALLDLTSSYETSDVTWDPCLRRSISQDHTRDLQFIVSVDPLNGSDPHRYGKTLEVVHD